MDRLHTGLMATALAAALLAMPQPMTAAEDAPAGLRYGPFIQSVLGEKATVLWFGDGDKPGKVRYGLAADKLDRTADSTVRALPKEAGMRAAFAHEAVLTGLPPGSDIHYRLIEPADPRPAGCFRSDPGPRGTIRFICAGDEVYFEPYLPFLKANGIRLDFVLDSGDYQSRLGRYGRPWWRDVPVYLSWGNHNTPENEKHQWALPGNKLAYEFELGPAFFAFSFSSGPVQTASRAAWRIAAEHPEIISNGKGANGTQRAARFSEAGYALRLNGNDHRYDRTYPVWGERRDPCGTVFLTHGGYMEATRFVRPAVSNYYVCQPEQCVLLPLVTISPQRLEVRVLLHNKGEVLPRKDWPADWPADAEPPRDYPHEWDYYVRVKDPQYAPTLLGSLQGMLKTRKAGADAQAVVRELGGLVEARAVASLTQLLQIAPDEALRREIALALDRIGEPNAMAAMKTLAADKNPMTRIAAARFFAKFGTERDAAELAAFAKDDEGLAGKRGAPNVCPQKYYIEGLMLRIGGAEAYRLAGDLFGADPHYSACVLNMLARDQGERKLPMLRSLVDRLLTGKELEAYAAQLAAAFAPVAQGDQDVARLEGLAGKLPKLDGWDAIAAGLAANRARQHVPLLVKAYRRSASGRGAVAAAAAIRKALAELTGLSLPDPVTGTGKQATLNKAKLEEGAKLAEQWAPRG